MKKILIAEDEELSRLMLGRYLREYLGADALICTASNGREAVDIAERLNPQLIFMDIEMPILNGIEAAQMIRKRYPETKTVFLTAFDRFDYAVGAMRAGGSDYLLKPFDKPAINRYLETVFGPQCAEDRVDVPAQGMGDTSFEEQFAVWLENNFARDISLEQAAESMGMSTFYFSRRFRAAYDQTFLEYLSQYRMRRAAGWLKSTEIPVREIAVNVGYPDANYFSKVFKRLYRKTPSAYRDEI